ncbi:amidophosphoribosyltransferase [Candidatus Fermentibacterales bacterium]|nr:amidophosphoribosyltransferase [Candidatus Fermentibacterales bacterium]
MAPREHCGLCGIAGTPDSVPLAAEGLFSQQHRGQEAAGLMAHTGTDLVLHTGTGLVAEAFANLPHSLMSSGAMMAIGHVRYGTFGSSVALNTQPLAAEVGGCPVGIAHNGTIHNASVLRRNLQREGAIFQTDSDTEVVLHLMARNMAGSGFDVNNALLASLEPLRGAYCLLLLTREGLIALRDPLGFRPLSIGRLPGGGWAVASETIAFSVCGAEYVREVEPGEMLFMAFPGGGDPVSTRFSPAGKLAQCIFEHVYFARPGSLVFGDSVSQTRTRMGARLAREAPCEVDAVVPVPDSGTFAAMGYSRELGLPQDFCFTRNHYIGRTFISPASSSRSSMVMRKLQIIPEAVRGRKLCVVEDSIVRGTTSLTRIRALRAAGAAEVHMRVCCPPHRFGCYFGIDFPEQSSLVAYGRSVEEIRELLDLDSLAYLSEEGMLSCVTAHPSQDYCTACFSGVYASVPDGNPIPPRCGRGDA